MLDQLFNSKTRVKILSLFENNDKASYYLQEIVRLTKTDPASIHRELKTLEEMDLLTSKSQGKQKYFKINTQNPYWKTLEHLIAIHKNSNQNKWFYYTDSKDIFPLIHFSTVDEKLNQVFFKKIGAGLNSLDFASLNTAQNTDMWLKYEQCNEIEQKFTQRFFEKPEQIIDLCQEAFVAGQVVVKFAQRWQKLNFNSLSTLDLSQELSKFVLKHGQFEVFHWLHSVLETGNLVINQKLQSELKIVFPENYYSVFGFLTNVFEDSKADDQYNHLLTILKQIQGSDPIQEYFKLKELRLIQKELWDEFPELYLEIRSHTAKYGYLGFGRKGPAWSEHYFIEILKNLAILGVPADVLLTKNQSRKKYLKETQQELEKKLSSTQSMYFKAYRLGIQTKIYRKEITHFCYELLNDLLVELSNKTDCTVVELQQMYESELSDLKTSKKLDKNYLSQKSVRHLMIRENHTSNIFTEPECFEILNKLKLPIKDKNHAFYGKCFVAGRVRGQSFFYNSKAKDIPSFSILIIDSKTKNIKTDFLEKNLKNILGIVFIEKPQECDSSVLFARQYNIPCIIDTNLSNHEIGVKLLDIDATYGKIVVVESN